MRKVLSPLDPQAAGFAGTEGLPQVQELSAERAPDAPAQGQPQPQRPGPGPQDRPVGAANGDRRALTCRYPSVIILEPAAPYGYGDVAQHHRIAGRYIRSTTSRSAMPIPQTLGQRQRKSGPPYRKLFEFPFLKSSKIAPKSRGEFLAIRRPARQNRETPAPTPEAYPEPA